MKPHYNTYSWKPIIIHKVLYEKKGNIFWMDSANQILRNLKIIWEEIRITGTYIPYSGSGSLKEWTIQNTLDYLNVPYMYYSARNRAGNTCAFSYQNERVRELVTEWKNLSLIKECIKAEGANRSNHRDDQSLLTILLLIRKYSQELRLTNDEVNISSSHPTPYLSVRNRFPKLFSLNTGKLAYRYFNFLRLCDIFINKIKIK